MSVSIGSNTPSLLNYLGNANASDNAAAALPSATDTSGSDASTANSSSTVVTLSDAAKAYLAQTTSAPAPTPDAPPTIASRTADARAWFDQQYTSLGISSPILDGQVAVDLSGQSRATLSVVADNTLGQFTKDESAAATTALQGRFNDVIASHVVVARHTGDYASLYAAASDYLDQAGDDEKATAAWKDQKQAVLQGLSAARASFGKAPDTGNADDPVKALLDQTSASAATPASGSTPQALSAIARAALDAQANKAKDNGTELVFSSGRTGQQVDFSSFSNRSLAIVALNTDGSFSKDEAGAAKSELQSRSRSSLLSAFDPTSSSGGGPQASGVALMQQYSSMSSEEKAVLGVSDSYASKIAQSYRTVMSIQNSLGGSAAGGLMSYL